MEESDKREHWRQVWVGVQGFHHCLPFDVVESPNTVNGEQRLPWIKLHQRPDHACDAICSCSSGKRVLERHASSLEPQCALLRHCARHPPAKSVARNDPSDAPVVLHQRCHGSHGQCIRDFTRQICLAQMFCSLSDQMGGLLVVKHHLVMLICNPAAEPLGALRKLLAYFSWSNSNWW